jgi:hypothetical protein
VIYDSLEQAYTVLLANFAADFTALATAKSVTVTSVATIKKRVDAETMVAIGVPFPAIGVYGLRATTQAKDQTKRDTTSELVFDCYHTNPDPALAQKQAELMAEACLKTVDRLAGSGGGVFGAGEAPGSVEVDLDPGFEDVEAPQYGGRVRVRFPVSDRDTGL